MAMHGGEVSPGAAGFDWDYDLVLERDAQQPSVNPLKQEDEQQQEVVVKGPEVVAVAATMESGAASVAPPRPLADGERSRFKFEAEAELARGVFQGFWSR